VTDPKATGSDPADEENPYRDIPGHPRARGTLPLAKVLTDPAIEDAIQEIIAAGPVPGPDLAAHLARLLRIRRMPRGWE
jgi:hypothetical protein